MLAWLVQEFLGLMPLFLLSQFDNAKVRKIQMQNNSFPRLFFIKSKIFLGYFVGVTQLRSCAVAFAFNEVA
jgi:hypothetical protein